jgi:hypothetical protein
LTGALRAAPAKRDTSRLACSTRRQGVRHDEAISPATPPAWGRHEEFIQ